MKPVGMAWGEIVYIYMLSDALKCFLKIFHLSKCDTLFRYDLDSNDRSVLEDFILFVMCCMRFYSRIGLQGSTCGMSCVRFYMENTLR